MAMDDVKPTVQVEHVSNITGAEALPLTEEKWWNWRVLMNLIIVGLTYALFGFDNGVTSPLISLPLLIEKYQGLDPDGPAVFTARNLNLVVCLPLIGAFFASFAAIPMQRRIGRKGTLIFAYSMLCLPGSILQIFAPSMASFVVGRIWNIAGVSFCTNVAPIYLSELIPVKYRARAVGFTVAGSAGACLISVVVVWATEKISDSRQYLIPLAVQAAIPLVLAILSLLLTESPIWMLTKGRHNESSAALASLRAGNMTMVNAELSGALIALQEREQLAANVNPWEILNAEHLERTLTSGALLSLSQVGGQILVGTYSTVTLVQNGVQDPFKITVIIFSLQFLGSVIGPSLVDGIGRRPVALVGFVILLLLDIAAGGLACGGLKTDPERLALASLCIIFAFINSASFQSLAYVAPTEIPTSRLREPTMTWAMCWGYTSAIITTFAVPQITSADAGNLGAKTFLLFGGCMVVTIIWSYLYFPETKNRSLAEIDELYATKLPKRHWKDAPTTATNEAIMQVIGTKTDATVI